MRRLFYLLAPAAFLLLVACQPPAADTAVINSIEVSGEGEVVAVPDRYQVRASVTAVGKDVAELKRALDTRLANLQATLQGLGLAESQLRADDLQVQPEWQWQPERRLIGQRVTRSMAISANGFEQYTRVLDALAQADLDNIFQEGSHTSNEDELDIQALEMALDNAREKAERLAARTGHTLGDVLLISETGGGSPVMPLRMMEAASADGGYSPGERRIQKQLTVRFELVP